MGVAMNNLENQLPPAQVGGARSATPVRALVGLAGGVLLGGCGMTKAEKGGPRG